MKTERTYVKVNSDFDATGYMQPKSITWTDGRIFKIDAVKDLCPVRKNERYTIVIKGEERYLFYERPSELLPNRFGRWYVESVG